MIKNINLDGKEYKIRIEWSGGAYCVQVIGIGGFHAIPSDCLDDIEKIKPYILQALENKHDLAVIEKWDGNMNCEITEKVKNTEHNNIIDEITKNTTENLMATILGRKFTPEVDTAHALAVAYVLKKYHTEINSQNNNNK